MAPVAESDAWAPGGAFVTAGLSEEEALARHARGEGNTAPSATGRSYWQILRASLFTAINGVLVALAATLVGFGRVSDAVLTAGIVLVNGAIDTVQQVRAKRALDRIALLVRPRVVVIRGGRERTVAPDAVVRGDLVLARAGDQLIADGRIVGAGRIEVDEASLTGEAEPVTKRAGDTVSSGTVCVAGEARYVAERVGAASFANQLTARARAFRQVYTPLQREIDVLVRALVLIVAFLGLIVALATVVTDLRLVEAVQIGAVLAGLIPNGLLLLVTVAYAIGAVRMAGRGALIQQPNAIESLANVDVLCLDKTGTLTANRLAVEAIHAPALPEADFARLLANYVASASGHNQTSTAILAAYPGQARAVRAAVPFSSARKWSALTFDDGTYVLGAPEVLIPRLAAPDGPVGGWLARGLRVLLLARAPGGAAPHDSQGHPALAADLEPLGYVALRDELRPEAAATLRSFAAAGVRLKVISGDHPAAVAALAAQAGLGGELRVVSGGDLDGLDDARLGQVAEDATIFGRITPDQKARLVGTLRARGHYVAMTGDGVNDVLALKGANLAIAMQGGSAAARGVADLVLLDDSFAAVPRAFAEGQRILNGLRDCLALYLTRLGYMLLSIVALGLALGDFPFTPKTTALISFLTIGAPTFALVAWAPPGPRPRRGVIRSLAGFVAPAALLLTLLGLGVYVAFSWWGGAAAGGAAPSALTGARGALTTALVLGNVVLLPLLPPHRAPDGRGARPRGRRPALLALAMLALYGVVLATPRARAFFDLAPLGLAEVAAIGGAVALWLVLLWWVGRGRLLERFLGIDLR